MYEDQLEFNGTENATEKIVKKPSSFLAKFKTESILEENVVIGNPVPINATVILNNIIK